MDNIVPVRASAVILCSIYRLQQDLGGVNRSSTPWYDHTITRRAQILVFSPQPEYVVSCWCQGCCGTPSSDVPRYEWVTLRLCITWFFKSMRDVSARYVFKGNSTSDPVALAMQRHLEWIYLKYKVGTTRHHHSSLSMHMTWCVTRILLTKVDVVLAGHEHLYMRMCSIRGGRCADDAPVYIIDGTGGAYTGIPGSNEGFYCQQPQPPFADPTILAQDCMWVCCVPRFPQSVSGTFVIKPNTHFWFLIDAGGVGAKLKPLRQSSRGLTIGGVQRRMSVTKWRCIGRLCVQ